MFQVTAEFFCIKSRPWFLPLTVCVVNILEQKQIGHNLNFHGPTENNYYVSKILRLTPNLHMLKQGSSSSTTFYLCLRCFSGRTVCCFLNVFQCEIIYFYFLSWFLPACFLHLDILCFHYPGSHGDQICDAATKASKDCGFTRKITFAQVHAWNCLSGICSERIFNVRVICNMKCYYDPPTCTLTAVPNLQRFQNAHSNINQHANSLCPHYYTRTQVC